MALALAAGVGIAGVALGVSMAVPAYQRWASQPRKPSSSSWGGGSAAKKNYPGLFDAQMTRKEAALILGVRQSASRDEISTRWKKLMALNHPDNGGSTFIASKVNEARDFLLSGKQDPF
eukprot:a175270_307.p3 GENE.a175270_307~~a175270_307.p3  ORF type:complete len:134 (-),score=49.60 a175270_307:170-526(-)